MLCICDISDYFDFYYSIKNVKNNMIKYKNIQKLLIIGKIIQFEKFLSHLKGNSHIFFS